MPPATTARTASSLSPKPEAVEHLETEPGRSGKSVVTVSASGVERVASQCRRTPLSSAWAAHESWTTRRTNEFRVVEPILGAVREAGLGGAEAAVHYRMIGDTRLAYIGQQAAFLMFDADARAADDSAWNREYRLVDPQHFPNVTRLSGELAEVTDDQIFDATVVALISAGEGGKPHCGYRGDGCQS